MIYQFKITLMDSTPPIWRRIQVPSDYSFWDLHTAIQDSMGWTDSHPHLFEMINPETGERAHIGIPDEEDYGSTLDGWKEKLSKYFSFENNKADYTYDFGDDWLHKIVLEKVLPEYPHLKYPVCVGGDRTCPPEDCGGMIGYENMLQTLRGPRDEEYERIVEWLGREDFNSEAFSPESVVFDDPKRRYSLGIK
ncbi:MAG: plasmid pRiA4b ORF-3 family protein [Alphaproteobacteria bacterium]|nr:plasmid pRiA4b ORF-3 family protein [Alphaproteobacteria bacterium]